MTIGPRIAMPGAFHLEAPNGAAPLTSGVHAGIFRPPSSPSASSSLYLAKSTGSLYSDSSTPAPNPKRKRQNAGKDSTPINGWATNMDEVIDEKAEAGRMMSGGREIRYTLAGQIDTPNGEGRRELSNMEDSTYSDIDYRRALGSKRPHADADSPLSGFATASPSQAPGWSKFALNTIGGVVGKVWEFCKAGAFRGFYAGGGTGYEMTAAPSHSQTNGQVWCNEHDIPTLPEPQYDVNSVPGGFPQSDYAPYYYERETPESTPPPAAKRRQIFEPGTVNDELRKNWVMVNDPADRKRPSSSACVSQASPACPPTYSQIQTQPRPQMHRRISKPISRLGASPLARRHSARISHAGSASLSNREPASFASGSGRASFVTNDNSFNSRPSTPSRIPVPSRPQSPSPNLFSPTRQQPSRIPNPSPNPYNSHSLRTHRRTQSTALNASNTSTATGRLRTRQSTAEEFVEESSPRLSAEAKRMAVRKLEEEQETDARINTFNARLQAMIRQGREALGTTVEVDGDDGGGMDGMWEDE